MVNRVINHRSIVSYCDHVMVILLDTRQPVCIVYYIWTTSRDQNGGPCSGINTPSIVIIRLFLYYFATGGGHPDPLLEGDEPLHIQSTSHRPRGVRQLFHRLQRSRRDQVGTWKEVGNWAASDKGANMSSVCLSVSLSRPRISPQYTPSHTRHDFVGSCTLLCQ